MIQHSFPIPVYKVKFEDVEFFKKNVITKILNHLSVMTNNGHPNMKHGGIVTYSKIDISTWKELELLFKFIKEHFILCWNVIEQDIINYNIEVLDTWISYYPPGAYFDFHSHGLPPISSVFYLQKQQGSGNLIIRNDRESWVSYNNQSQDRYSFIKDYLNKEIITEDIEIEVDEGDVIMFPSFLQHKTQPNNSKQDRIIVGVDPNIERIQR